MGRTKARVNSRINNVKGKSSNSFLTKVQGIKDNKKNSCGFCLLHRTNVDKKRLEIKNCIECEHFIDFKNIKKNETKGGK